MYNACACTVRTCTCTCLMRDEKEGRKKQAQGQTTRQSNTAHQQGADISMAEYEGEGSRVD